MQQNHDKTLHVSAAEAWQRLDRLLDRIVPELSLRGRRRLIELGKALVDGQQKPAGFKVGPGQTITVRMDDILASDASAAGPYVVRKDERFAAVYKPAGMHSESLAGGGQGLDALLPELLGRTDARLVNRLDLPTSGLVLAALGSDAEQEFRKLENAGQVRKEYAVLVHGRVEAPTVLRMALDTSDRKKVRALGGDSPDPLRWTEIEPVAYDAFLDRTRLRAVILMGARHQIRAHLAMHGHPIVGDTLYGSDAGGERLYLHHARLEMPGFCAEVSPDWD
jgi:23S rRNA pseudouridine1911/1915/1917 synthase